MESKDTLFLLRSVAFGALAGTRSMSPPAMLSLFLGHRYARENNIVQNINSPRTQAILATLAVGEITADKFPNAPNRTFFPAVIGRAVTGGGVTALLWSLEKRPAWIGGLLGAAAAVAATYPTFNLRMWLGRTLPIPGATSWAGVLEDAVIWGAGYLLLRSNKRTIEQKELTQGR